MRGISDRFRYVTLDGGSRITLKPNGLLAGFRFRGPEPIGGNVALLDDFETRVSDLLARRGSEWCYHISVRRGLDVHYPQRGAWPSAMVYALDFARSEKYTSEGQHLPTIHHLWISYHPETTKNRFNAQLTGDIVRDRTNVAAHFESELALIQSTLAANAHDVERLGLRQTSFGYHSTLLDALYSEITLTDAIFAVDLNEPMFLDGILAPDELRTTNTDLVLNGERLLVATVWGYPHGATSALFHALGKLPVPSRYTARIIPLTGNEASAAWDKRSRQFLLASLDLSLFFPRNGVEGAAAPRALRAAAETEKERAESNVPYATMLATVVARCKDVETYGQVQQALAQISNALHLRIAVESPKPAMSAYLGSLPGEPDRHVVRRALLTQRAATKLAPVLSTWNGPERHPRKDYPSADPLLMLSTPTREPFRFYHHDGLVGHTLVLGKTGLGKSVFLRAMENGHLARYAGAEVITLDIGFSAWKYARMIRGHHQIADLTESRQFAFLSGVSSPTSRVLIHENVRDLVELWTNHEIALGDYKAIGQALENVATTAPELQRLSALATFVQSHELRDLFQTFERSFLDAAGDDPLDFTDAAVPYWAIEYGTLGIKNTRWVAPFIAHVQRKATEAFDLRPNRPRLFVIDEGAQAMKSSRIADLKERLDREGRKYNVSAVFASQQASEVIESSISQVIIEQCATRISFRNPNVQTKATREQYRAVGFSEEACDVIARDLSDRDFVIENSQGLQVCRLDPAELELTAYSAATADERSYITELEGKHGASWSDRYLSAVGATLPDLTNYAHGLQSLERSMEVSP